MSNIDVSFLRRELASLQAERNKWSTGSGGNGGGDAGGGPPGGSELEKRIESLEKAVPDIRERLARVETKLDTIEKTMASKADLDSLRGQLSTDIQKTISDATWRFVQISVVLAGLAFTAAKFIHP